MKKIMYLFAVLLVFSWSCTNNQNNEVVSNDNPLLADFTGTFGTPPFEQIKAEHYMPAFEAFKETSLFDQVTASAFRKNILELNGIKDALAMYLAFRGKEPVIDPLLKNRGLK